MRRAILLANSDMSYRGGTQAWIRQMHRTLSQEHDVDVYSGDGAPVDLPPFRCSRRYDLALINHWPAAQALRSASIDKRIVTSHGVIPFEEIPVLGADAYVAVSEAVQARIPFRSTVIRNPIDADHFAPRRPPSPTLRRVAFVSNRQGDALQIVREACSLAGLELRVVGKASGVNDPRAVYEWADVVVGIARVAMEALACGRNVLCLDYQGLHGMATGERLQRLWQSNFGGHAQGAWPSAAEVAQILRSEYDPRRNLRPQIVAEHHPERVARAYLDLADTVRPSRRARAVRRGPRHLMSPKVTRALAQVSASRPAG